MIQAYVYDESCIADQALAAYRVVVAGAPAANDEAGHVKYPGTQDANGIMGVTQHATSASGDTVLVRRAGVTKIEVASGSIAYGQELRPFDLVGRADYQSTAWLSGDGVIGQADVASNASGDIIHCWLNIRMKG